MPAIKPTIKNSFLLKDNYELIMLITFGAKITPKSKIRQQIFINCQKMLNFKQIKINMKYNINLHNVKFNFKIMYCIYEYSMELAFNHLFNNRSLQQAQLKIQGKWKLSKNINVHSYKSIQME